MAQELTARADEELQSGGNELIAAEFMWGRILPLPDHYCNESGAAS